MLRPPTKHPGYPVQVTAVASANPGPRRDFRDATPRDVRAALIPEEVGDFDRQWRAAMAEAADTLDLTVVFETLDSWRRRATITQSLGQDDYRRMLARAEYTQRTGEVPPGVRTHSADEVKAVIRERLGL